jgi:ABC-type bacteriocin/lantibiotic exporter with double-glycine peptidase domain
VVKPLSVHQLVRVFQSLFVAPLKYRVEAEAEEMLKKNKKLDTKIKFNNVVFCINKNIFYNFRTG